MERREVTHIVVRQGGLFAKEEKVAPIDMAARTTADEIDLRGEAGDLQFPECIIAAWQSD